MGCVQAKSSMDSPPRGLEKLKLENGHVGKRGSVAGGGGRRSTGQRNSVSSFSNESTHINPLYGGGSGDGKVISRETERDGGGGGGSSGGVGGGSGGGNVSQRISMPKQEKRKGDKVVDGKVISRETERDGGGGGGGSGGVGGGSGGGNVSQRIPMPKQEKRKGDKVVDGWPKWLTDNIPREALAGLVPKSAESYDKLDKIGQGTYSNVYKARDRDTGKIVALKKVRFETSEPESVKFMAREIMILQKLDHPNIVKLEGLATSRMQYSLYLVFEFMVSDLSRIISRPDAILTEPQIKCYMQQLLSGLQHCHERGILHRDIKGSNLLIAKDGMLKIADFGLANHFNPKKKQSLTSRVVTLWYRAPELLLGATDYGVGIDLWSAGCLLAEMFTSRPIMPGRTEVEQLHMIFKLCGSPSEDYWKRLKLSTTFRPPHSYKPSIFEAFSDFSETCLGLLNVLLALDPPNRGSADSALQHKFFFTRPLACDLSGLPVVYYKDDDSTQVNERRRTRNSKMKQRSQTQRERRRKDIDAENPKGDSGTSKEDTEKSAEPNVHRQELSGSTGSTSSSVRPARQADTPFFSISPVASPEQKITPRNQGYHNSSNISNLPPLPKSKTRNANYNKDDDSMHKLNQIHRSSSTREFRKVDQRKHSKLYAVED